MLTGRESLIRLIGKRRRFLPNRQSLLSTPLQGFLNLCEGKNGGNMTFSGEGSSEQGLDGESDNRSVVEICAPRDWVTCPVVVTQFAAKIT